MTTGVSSSTHEHVAMVCVHSDTHSTKIVLSTNCVLGPVFKGGAMINGDGLPSIRSPNWRSLPFLEDAVFRTR